MHVTLGSKVDGNGHFFTMKSLFGRETNEVNSTDLTLKWSNGEDGFVGKEGRYETWQDVETGMR